MISNLVDEKHEGYLSVYFGCMFAGKTRLLLMKLTKKQDLGYKTAYVTHGDDNRMTRGHNQYITTHWSCFSKASITFPCYRSINLEDIYPQLLQYEVIGIDEFQFFEDPKVVKLITRLVDVDHKIVYCVGLDTNFRRGKFGHILDLIPFADKCKKIRAKCEVCKGNRLLTQKDKPLLPLVPAVFSAKIGGNISIEKETGAQDKYSPLCRHHYLEYAETYLSNKSP